MKAATHKIFSFIFILLGSTPLLFTLFLTVQKKWIRERMREKMETHQLETVIIPENEVKWMDDHEIWVNDQMFDIRTRKLVNGLYTFTGMYDEEETLLVKKQVETNNKQQPENDLAAQLFKCLKGFYCDPPEEWAVLSYPLHIYYITAQALPEYSRAIPTPPPQTV